MEEWECHSLYTISIYSTYKEVLEIEIDITFEAKLLFSLHTQMQKSEYYIGSEFGYFLFKGTK